MFREPLWDRELESRSALESGLGADFYEFAQSPKLRGIIGQKEKEPLIACDKDSPLIKELDATRTYGGSPLFELYGDDLGHAGLLHRDAVQRPCRFHSSLIVSDYDELRFLGHIGDLICEAADIRIIERGINLIEQAEW